MSSRTAPRGAIAVLALLAVVAGHLVARAEAGEESALDVYLRQHPRALEEGSLGPLEARALQALTPAQAEAWARGQDPAQIFLESGESLANLLAELLSGGTGLVYVPLDACLVFDTSGTPAGPFAIGESREYFVRGTDLSAQGGSPTGCMVPAEAAAAVLHFQAELLTEGAPGRLRVKRLGGLPLAQVAIEHLRQGAVGQRTTGSSAVWLCEGACATGDIEVKSEGVAAELSGTVIGYFRPTVAADAPSVGNADTLDGNEAAEYSASSHGHDGSEVVSGVVDESLVDPLIARADEVFPTVLANHGPGSGVDGDLLDGLEGSAFRPRAQNVILVGKNGCDFLTVQEAIDAIGVDPRFPAASSANRYLIKVGPGEYAELVTMKPFVDVEGSGRELTKIIAATGTQTLLGASDAELRHLKVINTSGGQDSSVAIRNDGAAAGGGSMRLLYVAADATGGLIESTGVVNDNGASPSFDHVAAYAGAPTTTDIGMVNQNGAAPTVRNSRLAGDDAAIENRDTATARIANTELMGEATVMPPAVQSSYACVRVFEAGTLTLLDDECALVVNTPPTAFDDAYDTLGNTLLEVALAAPSGLSAVVGADPGPLYAGVLDNDTDAETPGSLTAAVVGGTVSPGAVVAMNADGSFSYTPPVGFTGVDTFDYEVTDDGGLMDTGTVSVTVSGLIWYVDNDNVGTADGRSATPYTSLAPIDAGGADDGKDGMGDTIFVFDGTGNTSGGILLETDQILHGHEIALDPAGFQYAGGGALVAASTAPTIEDLAGDVVELASGNTVRGLDIAATNGAAIFGSGSAGATIDRVGTTGTGSGTGVRFDGATGTISVSDLDVDSSSNWGVVIQNSSATYTFDASCSITNPVGVAFSVESQAPTVTYSGTITNSSIVTINITSTTGGSVLFDGSSIDGTRILLSTVGGDVTVDAAATTLDGSTMSGITIVGASTGTFRFDDVTISNPTLSGIEIEGGGGDSLTGTVDLNNVDVSTTGASPVVSIGGLGLGSGGVDFDASSAVSSTNGGILITSNSAGTIAFNGPVVLNTGTQTAVEGSANTGTSINFSGGLDIDTTSGAGFNVAGGTVNVDSSVVSTTVDTGTGTGVDIDATIGGGGITFDSVNVNGAGLGIDLTNTGGGSFAVTGGAIQNTTSRGFSANNVGGTVTIGASLANSGGRTIEIQGSTGSFTFSGLVDDNAQGINLSTNAGGSFTFQGGIDADTGGFTGFNASAGGTLEVSGAVTNTVDTTTGVGVFIDQVTIGGGGVTFRSVSVDGAANGIVLSSTGGGSFTVTGDGSTATQGGNDSGGIIQNTTGDGVALTAAQNVTLRNMTIGDPAAAPADAPDDTGNIGGDGVQASGVTNLDLLNVTIARTAGHGVNATGSPSITNLTVDDSLILNAGDGQEEHGLNLDELRGDNFVRRSLFDAFNETGIELINASGTVDLTIDDTTFQDNQATVGNAGEEAILIEAQGTASIVVLVTGTAGSTASIFDDIARQAIQAISLGSSSDIQLTVENSSFVETQAGDAVIIMNPDFSGSGNVTVRDNVFTDDTFGPFAVLAKNDSSGTLDATIQGNTVTNMQLLNVNHDDVGSGGAANGTSRILVGGTGMGEDNNVTVGTNNIAVDVIATETPTTGGAPDLSFTAHDNTTSQPDGIFTFTPGLRLDIQQATRANVNLTGNAFQGDPSFAGGSGIELKEQGSSVVGIQGFAGGAPGNCAATGSDPVSLFLDGLNPASLDASFVCSQVDNNIGSGTATLPTPTTLPSP